MSKPSHKLVFASALSLISLLVIDGSEGQAANLRFGFLQKAIFNSSKVSSDASTIVKSNSFRPLQHSTQSEEKLANKASDSASNTAASSNLPSAKQANEQKQGIEEENIFSSGNDSAPKSVSPESIPSAAQINEQIEHRYQDLIDNTEQSVSLMQTQDLLRSEGLVENTATTNNELLYSESAIADIRESKQSSSASVPMQVAFATVIFAYLGGLFVCIEVFQLPNVLSPVLAKLRKLQVPDSAILVHNKAFEQLQKIADKAQAINNNKFSCKEFLLFVKLKISLAKNAQEFQKLDSSAQLLQVAIDTKKSFLSIEQIELRYRGLKQQEFYDYIISLLSQKLSKEEFKTRVQKKVVELLPQLKTEEGRTALQSYVKELNTLSEHPLGLRLLSLFKKYQLNDYSVLRTVSDIVNSLQQNDLQDLKGIVVSVIDNYDIFEKLGRIIEVSESKPETYAKLLQYLCLTYKHQASYSKFREFLAVLLKWQKPYQSLLTIRQQYSAQQYKIPKEFSKEAPGINVYLKYKDYLDSFISR